MNQADAVILDVDGVILSFEEGFIQIYKKFFGKDISKVSDSYDCSLKFGIKKEEELRVWHNLLHEDGFRNLPLLPGADEAFKLLKDMGKKIHIVTGIADQCLNYRIENLHALGLYFDTIDNVPSGTASKLSKIQKYNAGYYFDDRLQHLNENKHIKNLFWIDCGDEQFGETQDFVTYKSTSLLDCVNNSGIFFELPEPTITRKRKF